MLSSVVSFPFGSGGLFCLRKSPPPPSFFFLLEKGQNKIERAPSFLPSILSFSVPNRGKGERKTLAQLSFSLFSRTYDFVLPLPSIGHRQGLLPAAPVWSTFPPFLPPLLRFYRGKLMSSLHPPRGQKNAVDLLSRGRNPGRAELTGKNMGCLK